MTVASRRFIGLLALAAALAAPSETARAAEAIELTTRIPGTLQVCLADFPPVSYKDGGVWKGADVDFLKAFASAHDLKFEVVEQPKFEDIWLKPGQGECDIAASGISDTPERRAAVGAAGCWSSHYYKVVRAFLVRKPDAETRNKVEDLRGKTVIATKGSTAILDLCYRMQAAGMRPCARPDGGRACPKLDPVARDTDPSCVAIEYPRTGDEANAAADLVAAKGEHPPFALGAGYVTVQALAERSPQTLALTWPHCNMTAHDGRIELYAELFSFVVSSAHPGLVRALNAFIDSNRTRYGAPPAPELGCKLPPWTQAPPVNPVCPRIRPTRLP